VNSISDYLTVTTPLPQYLPYARFLLDTDLSHTAKLLYTLLLDRATLSQKNNWIDAQGCIYVLYPLSSLAKDLRCSISSITRAFFELENAQLAERVRSGFSKPNRILLKVPHTTQNCAVTVCKTAEHDCAEMSSMITQKCTPNQSFPTKEEATNRKKQIEHELAAGTFLIPSSVTAAEFLMDWLPKQCSKHKWAPKIYESNLSTIQNLIIPYIGSMEMQKLKPYHMENLYTTLSKTPCGSYIEGKKQELTEKQKQRFLSGTTSLILKSTKTASSCRTIFMTSALKEELKKWLNQLAADEMKDPARYHDSGMLFRLPNGLAVEPVLIRKKFLKWQDAHPEFPRIVFHGLRHSSATYQLMISGGDVKAVQGTTGHATADMLVNTYAHIQQSSRVELGKKFEEGFYAKQEAPSPQALPAAGEPTISVSALVELLKNADPEVKAQLRLALLT
jgi:hypothetical protein